MSLQMKFKKLKHFNDPGHAHELTFSCYHSYSYLHDEVACEMFIKELSIARQEFSFYIWAHVLMPTHVHLIIWPKNPLYDISLILKHTKGRMSRKYGEYLKNIDKKIYEKYLITFRGKLTFRFWQRGGGYDRNMTDGKAIHSSIQYIEANSVRAGFVEKPEEWKWSSAYARFHENGLIPDNFNVPVLMS